MSCFDEQPDGDPHGECAAEIESLSRQIKALQADRDSAWANVHILERERQKQDVEIARLRALCDDKHASMLMFQAENAALRGGTA